MRIKQRAKLHRSTEHRLCFDWSPAEPGCGFAFECDAAGKVDPSQLAGAGARNYLECLSGTVGGAPIGKPYQRTYEHSYRESAIGVCDDCGRDVELDRFTCACDCGADYNTAGQRLAPRAQWGEETGESIGDILAADGDPWGGE